MFVEIKYADGTDTRSGELAQRAVPSGMRWWMKKGLIVGH